MSFICSMFFFSVKMYTHSLCESQFAKEIIPFSFRILFAFLIMEFFPFKHEGENRRKESVEIFS